MMGAMILTYVVCVGDTGFTTWYLPLERLGSEYFAIAVGDMTVSLSLTIFRLWLAGYRNGVLPVAVRVKKDGLYTAPSARHTPVAAHPAPVTRPHMCYIRPLTLLQLLGPLNTPSPPPLLIEARIHGIRHSIVQTLPNWQEPPKRIGAHDIHPALLTTSEPP